MTKRTMTSEELDEYFDNGGDVADYIVPGSIEQPFKARKLTLSMPGWLIDELDATARRLAVSRQAIINMWLAERLQSEKSRSA